MPDANDMELVREFAGRNSEPAFAELVRRHINLVYSVAMRFTGNPGDAEDVTQAVFILLARKAAKLSGGTVLTGWLYETTRLTASSFLRSQNRRRHWEQEAFMQSNLNAPGSDSLWRQLAPNLEAAMSRLAERDRTLLALRFYENKTGAEAAALLGIREAAAHKRTARALEKLREFFSKHGVDSTAAIIANEISANSISAAPVALAKTVTAVAIAKGATASISTLTLIKGALKIMAWTKMKTAIVAGAVVLLAAGITTVAVKQIREHASRSYPHQSWQIFDNNLADSIIKTTTPQVKIVPTAFPKGDQRNLNWAWTRAFDDGRVIGMNSYIGNIMRLACSENSELISEQRTIVETNLSNEGYDFIANLKNDSKTQLRLEIQNELGIVGKIESRSVNVLALRESTNRDGMNAGSVLQGVIEVGNGKSNLKKTSVDELAKKLEGVMHFPVVDQTGISNHFYLTLKWTRGKDGSNNEVKKVLADQLGLELIATNMPIKMLVVGKVK